MPRLHQSDIGKLVYRVDPISVMPTSQIHRLESVVDGDAVTKCGRRMNRFNARDHELEVAEAMDPEAYNFCDRCS